MKSIGSELIGIQTIPHAGRGVVASTPIAKDSIVLISQPPAVNVISREYRKEVCAQCFLYDRGRTLSVRDNSTGKVFCTPECQEEWLNEQGELGLLAWRNLNDYIQSRSKAINGHIVPLLEEKPDRTKIENAWAKAATTSELQRQSKASEADAKNKHVPLPQSINPHLLGYLLAGLLFYHKNPDKWRHDVLDLTLDATPYGDTLDLEAHCNSFVQLSAILPLEIIPDFTVQLCQTLIGTTSYNSFGIRAGSDSGEEYMGYALYPDASYFNHSCSPNIGKKRIGPIWEFRALRDIQEGEQCCITYLGGDERDLTITARRARLRVQWDFTCMCERCSQESEG